VPVSFRFSFAQVISRVFMSDSISHAPVQSYILFRQNKIFSIAFSKFSLSLFQTLDRHAWRNFLVDRSIERKLHFHLSRNTFPRYLFILLVGQLAAEPLSFLQGGGRSIAVDLLLGCNIRNMNKTRVIDGLITHRDWWNFNAICRFNICSFSKWKS
jgi:hypothetical protein